MTTISPTREKASYPGKNIILPLNKEAYEHLLAKADALSLQKRDI